MNFRETAELPNLDLGSLGVRVKKSPVFSSYDGIPEDNIDLC